MTCTSTRNRSVSNNKNNHQQDMDLGMTPEEIAFKLNEMLTELKSPCFLKNLPSKAERFENYLCGISTTYELL